MKVDIPYIAGILVGNTAISDTTTWHYAAITKNGTTWTIYVDGALDASTYSGYTQESATSGLSIGRDSFDALTIAANLDEAHVSNIARSADWINTEYNNQNAPQGFSTLGAETAAGGAATVTMTPIIMWSYAETDRSPHSLCVRVASPDDGAHSELYLHTEGAGE